MKTSNEMILRGLLIVFITALISGCNRQGSAPYSHFEEIGSRGWDQADCLVFEPWPCDSVIRPNPYALKLTMRFSTRSNPDLQFPINVEYSDSTGTVKRDTIIAGMGMRGANVNSAYGVQELSLPLDSAYELRPGATVCLTPLLPADHSRGLLNVGLTLE